jgi:hypothetical protein
MVVALFVAMVLSLLYLFFAFARSRRSVWDERG